MKFIELHFTGGIEFMSVLSMSLLSILVITVLRLKSNTPVAQQAFWMRDGIRQSGYFSLFWGLLGQLLGLMGAFEAIEKAGEVSQGLLAGGLYVSCITTAYGLVIFLISLILDFVIRTIRN